MSQTGLRWIPLAAAFAATIVWMASAELALPARIFAVVLIGVLPPVLLVQDSIEIAHLERRHLPSVYLSSMLLIWVIGLVAYWMGTASGFSSEDLGLVSVEASTLLIGSGATTVAALGIAVLGRVMRWNESPILEWLLPRAARERALFALLSVSAGIGEELAFRAFLIPALRIATGSTAMAVVVSSAAFGLMHSYQRLGGAVRAGVLGAVLAIPFVVTGSVYPSMIAHATFDLIVGLLLADWLLRRADRDVHPPKH